MGKTTASVMPAVLSSEPLRASFPAPTGGRIGGSVGDGGEGNGDGGGGGGGEGGEGGGGGEG